MMLVVLDNKIKIKKRHSFFILNKIYSIICSDYINYTKLLMAFLLNLPKYTFKTTA